MKIMLKLNQNGGKNWYTIMDDLGCTVSGTKEELNGLYQQLIRIKGGLPQERTETTMVILENNCNCEKVQLELSNSALRLLWYLSDNGWFDDDITITEIDETEFERFV